VGSPPIAEWARANPAARDALLALADREAIPYQAADLDAFL
jgi:hypothetical protein